MAPKGKEKSKGKGKSKTDDPKGKGKAKGRKAKKPEIVTSATSLDICERTAVCTRNALLKKETKRKESESKQQL